MTQQPQPQHDDVVQQYEPMRLSHILPNFRVANYGGDQVVEIPTGYGNYISPELPTDLRDQVRKTIQGLVMIHGSRGSGSVYNEAQDDGSVQHGYLIPLGAWDFAGSQKVPGWKAYTTTTTTTTTQQHRNGGA